jgi:cytochrome c556
VNAKGTNDMKRKWSGAGAFLSLLIFAAVASAQSSTIIQTRITGFRDIGASFKNIRDELNSGRPNVAHIRTAAITIDGYAAHIPEWFPRGSQPPPRRAPSFWDTVMSWFSPDAGNASVNLYASHAKPEIWSDAAGFRRATQNFQRESARMRQVAQAGEVTAIQAQYRRLAATCTSCHSAYREEIN